MKKSPGPVISVDFKLAFRWLRRLLVVLPFLLLLGYGVRAYYLDQAEKRFAAAVAEADRLDPGWRWDEVLARRAEVPEGENSALRVLAASNLLPKPTDWNPRQRSEQPEKARDKGLLEDLGRQLAKRYGALPEEEQDLPDPPMIEDEIAKLSPAEPLDPKLARELRAELEKVREAVQEARRVSGLPRGRYAVEWEKDVFVTRLPHLGRVRCVARLLALDAILAAHQGDTGLALASTRGVLNVGRSIGDEPMLVSVIERMRCAWMAVVVVERVLAQGSADEERLASLQALLEDEADQPLLLTGLRGERGAVTEMLGLAVSGQPPLDFIGEEHPRVLSYYGPRPPGWGEQLCHWLYIRPRARLSQAVYLEQMTRAVEAAKEDPASQRAAFEQYGNDVRHGEPAAPHLQLASRFLPNADRFAVLYQRTRARLQSARVAVAAERYRLAHGHWPETLEQLTPAFLKAAPADPFGGDPFLYGRFDAGVVVYSVGPNELDDGGDVAENSPEHLDVGCRLWDPSRRPAGRR